MQSLLAALAAQLEMKPNPIGQKIINALEDWNKKGECIEVYGVSAQTLPEEFRKVFKDRSVTFFLVAQPPSITIYPPKA